MRVKEIKELTIETLLAYNDAFNKLYILDKKYEIIRKTNESFV